MEIINNNIEIKSNFHLHRAIFLDRDGVINTDDGYVHKCEDFHYINGAIEALHILQDLGYLLLIITNQSGIARGYYTENDFRFFSNWMLADLTKHGVEVAAIYYCPHLTDASISSYQKKCQCRKPELGLFYRAVSDWNVSLDESYAIGDRMRDLSICNVSDCNGYLVGHTESIEMIEAVKQNRYPGITYAADLLAVAQDIKGK